MSSAKTMGSARVRRLGVLLLAGGALSLGACGRDTAGGTVPQWAQETAHTYDTTLAPDELKKLGVAWEFDDFTVRGRTHRGMEATPVVVDGVLYVTGPWSVVYALDAKTGAQLWRYDPEVDGHFARHACCDAVNRGVAVADGIVYVGTLDGYLAAVNAKTGKPLWKVDTLADRSMSYAVTGAPRIAGRNVVIGNGGAEMGARGYASAYDRKTGKLAWRFWAVPGDPAKGDETPEVTEARKTWDPHSAWGFGGGGTPWDSIVYDPETNIVYIGTGNGMPHPKWLRSPAGGDNLYLSSIVALDADTGRKKWHYQTTPGDSWDYTATQNMILANLSVGGRERRVIMQAPKNGFFYVLDRVTGELLSAQKYTVATWADHVDLKTGRPVFTEQGDFSKAIKLVWPSEFGAHNWHPMSYSTATGLVYIPVLEAPMTFKMKPVPWQPYTVIQGSEALFTDANTPAPLLASQPKPKIDTVLTAWDPVRQKAVWTGKPQPFYGGGTMTTSGGLVFEGSSDGYLTVYDGRDGTVLQRIAIGTAVMASPMAYTIDGERYVAVTAGLGGAALGGYPPDVVANQRVNTERLIVFKLGGAAPALPPLQVAATVRPAPAQYRGTAAMVRHGADLFATNCSNCHGTPGNATGYPDLWNLPPSTHAAFQAIVHDGAFSYAGMSSFSDVLSKKDIDDIHAFISTPPKAVPPVKDHNQ
ncbi:PQQ-dependent dehydrogenase, methanol/ethanol family [Sphingomonas bacterium]|uniref:PQQ-dependent dehydrogenase, methanol/ethanol family n=1 Tax=Sphingomonas bacterium TaxID=1895847 RepID=UPI0020C7062B|nr:PQQ-dependent dehydrogenase, methanol/ethanol family [Sphingomonas bacterium]